MSKKTTDVITVIECVGDGNYLLKIANSPDTKPKPYPAYQWPQNNYVQVIRRTTPAGTPVQVAVNFPDLLQKPGLVETALQIYDDVQQRRLPGEWFDVKEGKLNLAWFR